MAHTTRRALWLAACGGGLLAQVIVGTATPILTGQASGAPTLEVGASLGRSLKAGEAHEYRIAAKAGDVLIVVIEQRGADVALALTGPPGAPTVTLDGMDDDARPERLATLVASSGVHNLRVSGARPSVAGEYRLTVEAVRPATDRDQRLVDGERIFAEARRTRNVGQGATWEPAVTLFQSALDQFARADDRLGVMKTTLEIGITENYLSKPEALTRGRDAVTLARAAGERGALARALRLVGNILVARADYAQATDVFDEAVAAAASIGARNSEARGLNDGAIAYRRRGDVEHAVDLYERALVLARATKDEGLEGNIVNNLGVVYKVLGELDRAVELFQLSLGQRRAAGDTRGQFNPLLNLSNVARARGDFMSAEALAREALAVSRASRDRPREARALNLVGEAAHAAGRHDEAVEHHRQALALARSLPDRGEESLALTAMSRGLRGLGRLDEARQVATEALAMSRRVQAPFDIREDVTELALIERDRGNLATAAAYLAEALTIDETARSAITSPELRASFVASVYDRYELALDVLHRLHESDTRAGFDARGLEISERARARVLLDGLLDGGVDLRTGIAPELRAEEARVQRSLSDTSRRLAEAVVEGKTDAVEPLQAEAQRLTADLARVQADVRRQSPAYADLMLPQPLTAARIQRDVLDADTVLLEFAIGESASWLWAVTTDTLSVHALPGRADVERAARRWHADVVARQPRPGERDDAYRRRVTAADRQRTASGQALSDLLLGAVADRFDSAWRGKRLALVAAGVLDILPFDALPAPRPPGVAATPVMPLLATGHEIVRVPSASVIAALRDHRRVAAPAKSVAVLADPVFERTDPRVAGASAPGPRLNSTPATSTMVARNALGQARLARLPFSREEADGIARFVSGGGVMKATGFEATRDAALAPTLGDYRIIHYATHGVVDSARPSLSGLIFSLVDRRGVSRNGYVRLHDIYNLRLNAELVVLSACDTALGANVKGEGLIGLARAFMYAGAPTVIASLWSVNDVATAELMTRFYRQMLQRGRRPAAALAAAQREMRASAQWSDPYYWAGFTLIGDWR